MAEHYEYECKHYFFARAPLSGWVTCAFMAKGPNDSRARAAADALAALFDVLQKSGIKPPKELRSGGPPDKNDPSAPQMIPMLPTSPEGPLLLVIDGQLEPGQVYDDADEVETVLSGLRKTGP